MISFLKELFCKHNYIEYEVFAVKQRQKKYRFLGGYKKCELCNKTVEN